MYILLLCWYNLEDIFGVKNNINSSDISCLFHYFDLDTVSSF